jgi:hypothetical protein
MPSLTGHERTRETCKDFQVLTTTREKKAYPELLKDYARR